MTAKAISLGRVTCDVLIVGAGLSGLMAAHQLQQQGLKVLLLDKGRQVGGRLATRRVGPGLADHGAQFFTARTPTFQSWIDRWEEQGLLFRWSTGWSDGSIDSVYPQGHVRYAVRDGMIALAKLMAQGLDVRVDTRLVQAEPTSSGWEAADSNGNLYASRALMLTPPVPQSLALLCAPLHPTDRASLERIEYASCMAGLFWLDRAPILPEPGAIQRPEAPIAWIADNQRKGISPEVPLVTVHASPTASRLLWPALDDIAQAALLAGLTPFLAPNTAVMEAQIKRWRYALPTVLHSEHCLLAADLPPLAFAGDAFGGARVEGAALSGLAAGEALVAAL